MDRAKASERLSQQPTRASHRSTERPVFEPGQSRSHRRRQPRLQPKHLQLVIKARCRQSSERAGTFPRDVSNAEVHVLDAGHFALDTKADEIATLLREFMKTEKQPGRRRADGD